MKVGGGGKRAENMDGMIDWVWFRLKLKQVLMSGKVEVGKDVDTD